MCFYAIKTYFGQWWISAEWVLWEDWVIVAGRNWNFIPFPGGGHIFYIALGRRVLNSFFHLCVEKYLSCVAKYFFFFFSAELHLKYWRVLSCFSSVVPALNSNTWIQRFLLGYFSKCLKILFTVFQTAFNWPISFMSDINCLLDGTLLIKKNCFILQKILLLHSHMDFKNKF